MEQKTTTSAENTIPTKAPVPDPFANLDTLVLSQDFDIGATVDFTVIPVRKPSKQAFIRVSPAPEHQLTLGILELERGANGNQDAQLFIVPGHLIEAVRNVPGFGSRLLRLCVQRPENTPFLWALRAPRSDKPDNWARSALEAATRAQTGWVSVRPDMALGAYTVIHSSAPWPDPIWPDLPMNEILRRAFGSERVIGGLDHPVLKHLRGEA